MKWKIPVRPVVACLLCLVLSMGITVRLGMAASDKQQAPATQLQSLQVKGEGAATELLIGASGPATYTSYKATAPLRFVIDFAQTASADSLAGLAISRGPIKAVTVRQFDTDAGSLTRMELFLNQDVDPVIAPSAQKNGELVVSFPGYRAVEDPSQAQPQGVTTAAVQQPSSTGAEAAEPARFAAVQTSPSPAANDQSATVVTAVDTRPEGIEIKTSGPVADYKTFRLNKPERLVIDISQARAGMVDKLVQINRNGVSTARIGSYPDKVRIVFDALNGTLEEATVSKIEQGLLISFAASAQPTPKAETSAPPAPQGGFSSAPKAAAAPSGIKQVTAVDFQVVGDISRVMVKVSGSPQVDPPVKAAGSVAYRIRQADLPRSLQRSFETREFASPVLRVTPVAARTKSGNDVIIRVTLKKDAPFEFRQEADILYLDLKHPADMSAPATASAPKASAVQKAEPPAGVGQEELQPAAQKESVGRRSYTGRKVTLEFADAEVRKIFQLLSEVSNKNFVLGDEVTGTISLKLVNVPWDQALDIILDTKGLDKREEGNIVLIRGKGKFKSLLDEEVEIKKAALKGEPLETEIFEVNYSDIVGIVTQFNAIKTDRGVITSDARTNKVIVKDVRAVLNDMGKLLKNLDVPEKQVMIEARIVEASTDFSRSLGISWKLGTDPAAGGQHWPFINSFNSVFGGIANTPGTSAIGSTTGAADITFGTIGANVKLSMRLNAAAKAGMVRIISSPKVATLNNKSAKITQGKQIPYISSTSDKIETKFVEAALSLEVTPHINNNGTIILKIDAKNDAPDTTSTSTTPPINKKQATTEMLLKDGETTVIGGIFVDSEAEGEEGIPWLMDIPILGNLFKSRNYVKGKTELLIFITPRILNNAV